MEILYWWLISLPIFFGLGWIAARIDIREVLREAKSLPRAFASSYRYLAEAKPELALKPFQDFRLPENVSFELMLSLGVLYRRQGQFSEAIRLHEQLHQRIDLSESELDEVAWELSQDYLKAGMLDRSVMCIQALITTERQNLAVRTMLEIFQAQRQWDKALEYANKISHLSGVDEHRQCSHFHCELAIKAHQRLDSSAVEHHLSTALRVNPRNVRIPILRGDFALANKEYAMAIEQWKSLENMDNRFLFLVIGKLHEAFIALGEDEVELRLLVGYFESQPSAPLLEQIYRALGRRLSPEKILAWLSQFEKSLQSWQIFSLALEAFSQASHSALHDAVIVSKLKQLAMLTRPQHFGFVCDQCGFLLQNHVWHCPGCGEWDTYPPLPRVVA